MYKLNCEFTEDELLLLLRRARRKLSDINHYGIMNIERFFYGIGWDKLSKEEIFQLEFYSKMKKEITDKLKYNCKVCIDCMNKDGTWKTSNCFTFGGFCDRRKN